MIDQGQQQRENFVYIESLAAGRVLDVSQEGDSKDQLMIYDKHRGSTQQFALLTNHLEVTFLNRHSGLYLTVANNSDKNGAVVREEPQSHQRSQRFRLQESSSGSGEFVIFTFCGKALDICENSRSNGTRIIQWDFHSQNNQKWIL